MIIEKTQGLIAAPFSPMHSDGSINLDVIAQYADHLYAQGVVGAFVCGTTGEGASLSTEERIQIAERWMNVAPQELKVIVHVGHTILGEAQRLAKHAQSIRAHSISCVAPFFFKPSTADCLVEWCSAIARSAPDLPFYYYHIPSMTGVSIPVYDFLQLAADRIPNLAGVKFTFEDIEDYRRCLGFQESRFDILFGRDEKLLLALQTGARGAVGSTYNFAAPLYRKIIKAFESGDATTASTQQSLAVAMIDTLIAAGPSPVGTFKWLMKRVGIDCGPVRQPLQNPTVEQTVVLQGRLAKLGLFL
jgi:N-acetylneuraminate lyase